MMIMKDPVITPAGHAYEREYIEKHIDMNHTDPITSKPLHRYHLIPDYKLKEIT